MENNTITPDVLGYIRGYIEGVQDSIEMIKTCEDSLTGMVDKFKDQLSKMGINIEDIITMQEEN